MNTKRKQSDTLVRASEARKDWGGISAVTEWRWIKRGIIKPKKINGRNYYPRSQVDGVGGDP